MKFRLIYPEDLALVAESDAGLTDDPEVAGSVPTWLANIFHGD